MRKRAKHSAAAPVLLIGWGREGAKDVYFAREYFGFDLGLDCVDAQEVREEEVLKAISDWLQDNDNAQVLYIGAHGYQDGLHPTREGDSFRARISWRALAEALSSAKQPITLCLGACSSVFAAEYWNRNSLPLVSMILGFSGQPTTEETKNLLKEVVQNYSFSRGEDDQGGGDLTYLEEDIASVLQGSPSVSIHLRTEAHGFVECRKFEDNESRTVGKQLDRHSENGEVAHLVRDVVAGLMQPPGSHTAR